MISRKFSHFRAGTGWGGDRQRSRIAALAALLALLLPGCVNLPGSGVAAPERFRLQGPDQFCVPAKRSLALKVGQVAEAAGRALPHRRAGGVGAASRRGTSSAPSNRR